MLRGFWIFSLFICLAALFGMAGCAGHRSGEGGEAISDREVELRLDLAESYLRNNEPRLALQELNLVESRAQTWPRYQFTLGYARLLMGNAPEAVVALRKSVDLDPNHGEAWNNLGLALLTVGDLEEAEEAFSRALAVPTYRTPEVAALNLAQLHLDRDQTALALRYVNLALELNWRFTNAYLLAAEIQLAQGQTDQAIQLLKRGAEANLDDPRILLALAEYLLIAGQPNQARPWLEQLLQTAPPDSREAVRARDYQQSLDNWQASFMGRDGLVLEQTIEETAVPVQPDDPQPDEPQPDEPQIEAGKTSALQTGNIPDPVGPVSSYLVQVSAFLDKAKAEAFRDTLLEKKYPAAIVVVSHKDKTWHVVSIADTQDRDEAETIAAQYAARESARASVVKVGQGRYLELTPP